MWNWQHRQWQAIVDQQKGCRHATRSASQYPTSSPTPGAPTCSGVHQVGCRAKGSDGLVGAGQRAAHWDVGPLLLVHLLHLWARRAGARWCGEVGRGAQWCSGEVWLCQTKPAQHNPADGAQRERPRQPGTLHAAARSNLRTTNAAWSRPSGSIHRLCTKYKLKRASYLPTRPHRTHAPVPPHSPTRPLGARASALPLAALAPCRMARIP